MTVPEDPTVTAPEPQFTQAKVADWIGINIQCIPLAEISRRQRAGESALNVEIHPLADKAHSHFPCNFAGHPHITARRMMELLDPGNQTGPGLVLRDFVNIAQLTEDGHYTGEGREQFLQDWLAEGGRVLFVIASMYNEEPTIPALAAGVDACREELDFTPVQAAEAMRRIVRLIQRLTPDQQARVVAVETMNEPAIYAKGSRGQVDFGLTAQECIDRFERDQADVARTALAEGLPDHIGILFPKFGYSGRASELLKQDAEGVSMMDRWRAEFGDRLLISAHLYPDWINGNTADVWADNVRDEIAKIDAPTIITETNSTSLNSNVHDKPAAHSGWVWPEIVAGGIPVMFFPGANWGAGAFLRTRGAGDADDLVTNPDRLLTWYGVLAAGLRGDPIDYTMNIALTRSEIDPRHGEMIHGVRVIRNSGRIVLDGQAGAYLIGGLGGNHITSNREQWCWIATGAGNDYVDASAGPGGMINLGQGADVILLGAERLHINGRGDADTYIVTDSGFADIAGFDDEIDRIVAPGLQLTHRLEGDHLILSTETGDRVRLLGCDSATIYSP